MKRPIPTFHLITDDSLHNQPKECIAETGHTVSTAQGMGMVCRLRIRAWSWITRQSESCWLQACGWHKMRNGWWGVPDWHPKRDKGLGPYDQNHAANSQRQCNMKGRAVRAWRELEPPYFSAASKHLPRQMIVYSVIFMSTGWATHSDLWTAQFWVPTGIALASILYTIYLSGCLKRDLRFDEAERILRGSTRGRDEGNGPHRDRSR